MKIIIVRSNMKICVSVVSVACAVVLSGHGQSAETTGLRLEFKARRSDITNQHIRKLLELFTLGTFRETGFEITLNNVTDSKASEATTSKVRSVVVKPSLTLGIGGGDDFSTKISSELNASAFAPLKGLGLAATGVKFTLPLAKIPTPIPSVIVEVDAEFGAGFSDFSAELAGSGIKVSFFPNGDGGIDIKAGVNLVLFTAGVKGGAHVTAGLEASTSYKFGGKPEFKVRPKVTGRVEVSVETTFLWYTQGTKLLEKEVLKDNSNESADVIVVDAGAYKGPDGGTGDDAPSALVKQDGKLLFAANGYGPEWSPYPTVVPLKVVPGRYGGIVKMNESDHFDSYIIDTSSAADGDPLIIEFTKIKDSSLGVSLVKIPSQFKTPLISPLKGDAYEVGVNWDGSFSGAMQGLRPVYESTISSVENSNELRIQWLNEVNKNDNSFLVLFVSSNGTQDDGYAFEVKTKQNDAYKGDDVNKLGEITLLTGEYFGYLNTANDQFDSYIFSAFQGEIVFITLQSLSGTELTDSNISVDGLPITDFIAPFSPAPSPLGPYVLAAKIINTAASPAHGLRIDIPHVSGGKRFSYYRFSVTSGHGDGRSGADAPDKVENAVFQTQGASTGYANFNDEAVQSGYDDRVDIYRFEVAGVNPDPVNKVTKKILVKINHMTKFTVKSASREGTDTPPPAGEGEDPLAFRIKAIVEGTEFSTGMTIILKDPTGKLLAGAASTNGTDTNPLGYGGLEYEADTPGWYSLEVMPDHGKFGLYQFDLDIQQVE